MQYAPIGHSQPKAGAKLHLVYVDGQHASLSPMNDFLLALAVLEDHGLVMLDDWALFPDVYVLKLFCDNNYRRVWETWKIAVYSIRLDAGKPA